MGLGTGKGKGQGDGAGGSAVLGIIGLICALGEFAFAVAIMVLVSADMYETYRFQCLLDGYNGVTDSTICEYAWAVAALSILVNFCVALFACFTACCCKISNIVSAIFDFLLAIWWLVGAIVFTYYGVEANNKGWPNKTQRDAIIGCAYGAFAVFIIHFFVDLKNVAD